MAETGRNIYEAKNLLERGEVVAIPTETVYGLAGNALNPEAVSKIFAVKNRPTFDPLIIHVSGITEIEKYTQNFPEKFSQLAQKYMPGPLTFLIEKKNIIPDIVTSGLGKVAIRIPDHILALELLKNLDFPLAAPSANPFGYVSPTSARHVFDQLGEKIPYILDGGSCKIGLESTIIGLENGATVVYRKGGLEIEKIEDILQEKIILKEHSSSNPQAPGMLEKHYSPDKKIEILSADTEINQTENIGFLGFEKLKSEININNQFILSKNGDLQEAARNLFEGLRWFDKTTLEKIYVELVPEHGLGLAINDRLRRAAAKS
ncbi:MAG: threonylcarbamoyl-AMP synthase [Bacteroidetes bacterium]|nr:threonylcarbamoyl-AMP synthase [Bacteroidota bacterium]